MNVSTGHDEPSAEAARSQIEPYGPAAVATVTMALTIWPIAFNLGAYHAVFYEDIFQLVVISTVGLAITTFRPNYRGRTLLFVRLSLAAPALWLALSVTLFDSTAEAASDPYFGTIGLIIVAVSIPTVLKLLIDLFTPDLASLRDSHLLGFVIAVVIVVASAGYAVGANNDAFLICDDFKVAGADQPANCAPG